MPIILNEVPIISHFKVYTIDAIDYQQGYAEWRDFGKVNLVDDAFVREGFIQARHEGIGLIGISLDSITAYKFEPVFSEPSKDKATAESPQAKWRGPYSPPLSPAAVSAAYSNYPQMKADLDILTPEQRKAEQRKAVDSLLGTPENSFNREMSQRLATTSDDPENTHMDKDGFIRVNSENEELPDLDAQLHRMAEEQKRLGEVMEEDLTGSAGSGNMDYSKAQIRVIKCGSGESPERITGVDGKSLESFAVPRDVRSRLENRNERSVRSQIDIGEQDVGDKD